MTPPRLWRALLRRVVPAHDRDIVVQELDLLYEMKAELGGRGHADRWYRGEALSFALTVPLAGLRQLLPTQETTMKDMLADLVRETGQAVRSLASQPGVSVVCLAALVLGIGANTLIFSIVDHVVLRPLPYAQPEQLVDVWPSYFLLRGEIEFFEENVSSAAVGAFVRTSGINALIDGTSRRLAANQVAPELLDVLDVQPLLGRNFLADEDAVGRNAVTLISYGLWTSDYGADANALGEAIVLDGVPHEIVGVLPAAFAFPDRNQDLLVPILMDAQNPGLHWGSGGARAVARLNPGATTTQLHDEMQALAQEVRLKNPLWTPNEDFRAEGTIAPLRDAMVRNVESNLVLLLGAVGLVLLVACANVSNLLLARAISRSHDLAVRAALGAGRRLLLRQQLLESLVLVLVGCALAVFVASRALNVMVRMLPAEIPRAGEIALDGRVLSISVVVAILAGLSASLLPAMRASRTSPSAALREGGRGSSASAHRRRMSAAMVVVQVSAAVVLVTGAGLLIRTLGALSQVDPGFETERVVTARFTLNPDGYNEANTRMGLSTQMVEGVEALPGGQLAAAAGHVPFGPGWTGMATFIEDVTADPNELPFVRHTEVTPRYFETMGIPLLQGRDIAASDRADTELVAVVDAEMVRTYWPDTNPIGKRIRYPWRNAPWITVIGVVGGTAETSLDAERTAAFYVPMAQRPPVAINLVARSTGGRAVEVQAI